MYNDVIGSGHFNRRCRSVAKTLRGTLQASFLWNKIRERDLTSKNEKRYGKKVIVKSSYPKQEMK